MLMWPIITFILLFTTIQAEVWEKPKYVPDENHLPAPEIQEQEERKEQQQKTKKEKEKLELYNEAPKKVTPKYP